MIGNYAKTLSIHSIRFDCVLRHFKWKCWDKIPPNGLYSVQAAVSIGNRARKRDEMLDKKKTEPKRKQSSDIDAPEIIKSSAQLFAAQQKSNDVAIECCSASTNCCCWPVEKQDFFSTFSELNGQFENWNISVWSFLSVSFESNRVCITISIGCGRHRCQVSIKFLNSNYSIRSMNSISRTPTHDIERDQTRCNLWK